MRSAFVIAVMLGLAACNHSHENKEAVRQAVVDRLTAVGMPGMNVDVTSVQFNGNQADATVSIAAKGMSAAQGMTMQYHLELKDGKWVAQPNQGAGQSPHGGGVAPGAANPHGGAMEAPGPGGKMPSPADLPPAGKGK